MDSHASDSSFEKQRLSLIPLHFYHYFFLLATMLSPKVSNKYIFFFYVFFNHRPFGEGLFLFYPYCGVARLQDLDTEIKVFKIQKQMLNNKSVYAIVCNTLNK